MARILGLIGGLRLRSGVNVSQSDIVHWNPVFQPRFRFEWHRNQRRLYVIDLEAAARSGQSEGRLIGVDLETEGAGYNALLVWCRGYRAGKEAMAHDDQGKLILLGGL
jgi:hypothetical protein